MKKSFELKVELEENSKSVDSTIKMRCSMLDAIIILADALYLVCEENQLDSMGKLSIIGLFNQAYAAMLEQNDEGKSS